MGIFSIMLLFDVDYFYNFRVTPGLKEAGFMLFNRHENKQHKRRADRRAE